MSDIIAVLTIAAFGVQLFYLFFFFFRADTLQDKLKDSLIFPASLPEFALTPVTVVICAKNEALNLQENLPYVLQQHYVTASGTRSYEVLVVNDQSDDNSAQVIAALQEEYTHLKCINIATDELRTFPGKKFALSRAVAAVTND